MANIKILAALISAFEGGYSNHPFDNGGPTNRGITLKTWQKTGYDINKDGKINEEDLVLTTHQDMVEVVLKPHYWDLWQADKINNQAIANMVVDWTWTSGPSVIPKVQDILQVRADGIAGPVTLHALNSFPDQELLFEMIKTRRVKFTHQIIQDHPEKLVFKRGWLDRIASIRFMPVIVLFILCSNLISCSSTGKHLPHVVVSQVENNQLTGETTEQHHQSLAATSRELAVSTCIDSITETTLVAFKLLSAGDTVEQSIPLQATGQALITHNKKVRTTVYQNKQQDAVEVKHDSTIVETEKLKTTRDQTTSKQPVTKANRINTVLTFLMAALLGLWIYYLFRDKKLF